MPDYIIYGLGGLVAYQIYVTIRVVRSRAYIATQKWRKFLIIWLVPFFGAAATLAVLATDEETAVRPEKDVVPRGPNDRG